MPLEAEVEAVEWSSAGRDAAGSVDAPRVLPGTCPFVALLLPPSLLPSRTLRLLNSTPRSFNLFSLPSLAPCNALGMASFSDLTSSLILRVSSSRRREEYFNSSITLSTSLRAVSRRSVRASSADFKDAVSAESWSTRANARENCSSICALSCSSCGGVGGEIRGEIYR